MLKKLISELEQESKKLQLLLDNIRENFFSADWVNNKVIYISDVCYDIYGYPAKNFLDDYKFWFKVIHPDDKEKVKKTHERLNKGEKVIREYRIIHAEGSIRWVQNTIVPTLNEEGVIIRVDGYTTDITEGKESQLKIEELNMLICRASHDLKGPLNSAKNYIAIAKDEVKDKTALGYLNKIGSAYDNMEQLVLSLLNLEKLHCQSVNIKKIDIRRMVNGILSSVNNIQGFSSVKISNDVKESAEIDQDADCMCSILYNLISNAIIYRRDSGDSFVNVNAYDENGYFIIRISDNGLGIPLSIQNKLFDKYVKGNNGLGGSGLGLYIVKKMVEKIGATISFDSEENKGTTFTIKLPYSINEINAAA